MVLARFRMPALAVTIGAAVTVPLLSLAPAQAAAGGNVGGRGPASARASAPSVINNTVFAGYQASVAAGSPTSSAAQFKVPRLSCTSAFRGITPGAGVQVNAFRSVSFAFVFVLCHSGRAAYVPALVINGNEVNYPRMAVRAGNVIKVSAKVTTTGTTVLVTNVTTGVTRKRTGPGARSSDAFAGDNAVDSNGVLGVPSFGTLTFTHCLIDGRALARSHPARYQRVNSRHVVQIATGALSSGGTAFPTSYKHF